ncbi:MAG TPA: SRPBCC family protein [Nitrososphaeraceae archaeon]|nr:SRPBCC family protein [Nitrososphaeraceae archaeon]
MTIRIDLTKEVKTPVEHVLDYFTNVEELPRFHPEYIKNVRIVNKEEGENRSIEFEQEGSFHGKKIKSVNRLSRLGNENTIRIEIIDGNGKGSITTIRCEEVSPSNTQIRLEGELHYGLLEKFLSRSIHGITEKTLEEDIHNLEQN